jgi:hypothetical protein
MMAEMYHRISVQEEADGESIAKTSIWKGWQMGGGNAHQRAMARAKMTPEETESVAAAASLPPDAPSCVDSDWIWFLLLVVSP